MKRFIRAEEGRVTQIIEFDNGNRIEIPIDRDGNVIWYKDKIRTEVKNEYKRRKQAAVS